MFFTELFITEVQKRPCLWNVKDSSHSDREQRLRAWDQIANALNTTSDSYCLKTENITINELQRKWKHLRDYYIREKKRTSKVGDGSIDSGAQNTVSSRRKRKSPLLNMLQFLDVNRDMDILEITVERTTEDNFYPENNDEEKSLSEHEVPTPRKFKFQRINKQQKHAIENSDNEDSSDNQFLTSLLPIIKNMNAQERSDFRAQLLNPTSKACPLSHANEDEQSRTPAKLKRNKTSKDEIDDSNKSATIAGTPSRDEFAIYGEYVANKLRNIRNAQARNTAEFHINGILYKAEMGEYDGASKDSTTTSKSTEPRETSNVRILGSVLYEEEDSGDIFYNVIKTEEID